MEEPSFVALNLFSYNSFEIYELLLAKISKNMERSFLSTLMVKVATEILEESHLESSLGLK